MQAKFLQNNYLSTLVLLLLGGLSRVSFGGSPLTGDEAITFNHYAFASWKDLILNYEEPNQHTLFSLLSNLSLQLFGENEWSFRLPSLLAGILAVPLTYRIGLLFLNSQIAALIAAFLILFSEHHLIYSQSGRGYALTALLALTMIWSLWNLISARKFWTGTLCFFISGLGLVLALPSNILFVVA